jgi:hypothetical protein
MDSTLLLMPSSIRTITELNIFKREIQSMNKSVGNTDWWHIINTYNLKMQMVLWNQLSRSQEYLFKVKSKDMSKMVWNLQINNQRIKAQRVKIIRCQPWSRKSLNREKSCLRRVKVRVKNAQSHQMILMKKNMSMEVNRNLEMMMTS